MFRPGEQYVLTSKAADALQAVVAAERAALYATPERCAQVERRQPEALEYGRPLFYVPDMSARRSKRDHVEEARPEPMPAWRQTFEFLGYEDELADEGMEAVGVAAD